MSDDLLQLFEELEDESSEYQPIKAPFAWPGGKSKLIKFIIPHLPGRNLYCEPFGGSAAILLARRPSTLEVYNDAFGGVVDFYRCLRDPKLLDRLIEWLNLTVNSREEFSFCKATWQDPDDPVERAGRWYYMTEYSFGSIGRNWGRAIGGDYTGVNGKIRSKLKLFPTIHERFRRVQIENQDAISCLLAYDAPQSVFYLDPPYLQTDQHVYKHRCDEAYHKRLLDTVFKLQGFAAVSGYPNALYNSYEWDEIYTWEAFCSINGVSKRGKTQEVLWVREAPVFK